MKAKKVEDHLPQRAPKRTGKKGIGPLDQSADFNEPVQKTTSLLVKQPPRPVVVGDRFEAFYLKPTFSKTKDGKKLVGLRFTVPLENEHDGHVPKIVHDGYRDVKKRGRSGMRFKDIPGQHVEIFLSQDIKEDALTLPVAKFLNCRLDIIERKGEGEVRKVIRLSFTLQVEQSHEVRNFATESHGNTFWLHMAETEELLFDEDDED